MKSGSHFWARQALIPACTALILVVLVLALSPIRAWAASLLRIGDEGDSVVKLQESLAGLGYDPGPQDGDFGPRTQAALVRFQTSAGLDPDGVCGPLTWGAIARTGQANATSRATGPLRGKVIVIDPGHGGSDPGAVSKWGDEEKDLTLSIAFKVRRYLEAQGASVVLTRYGDYSPGTDWGRSVDELVARASLAGSQDADAFVSIHVNSYPKDPGISGVMSFYRSGSPQSMVLARSLAAEVSGATGLALIDVQAGPYYVLNHTYMPAALVEVGFLTNWRDADRLRQDSFLDAAAKGIVGGVIDYFARSQHT